MSSAIGGMGGGTSSMMMGGMHGMRRPDPSKMAENLFSKLDGKGQGYIEKSDLQDAFDQISPNGASGGGASVDDVFAALDGDSDGKVTQQEMSDSIQKLADQLDGQFQNMRMNGMSMGKGGGMGMMGGMAGASGISRSDLAGMADSAGSYAQMMDDLMTNFDTADTDQDGKISAQEAMAFKDASQTAPASSSMQSSDAKIMQQIIELARSYGEFSQYGQNNSSTISVSA